MAIMGSLANRRFVGIYRYACFMYMVENIHAHFCYRVIPVTDRSSARFASRISQKLLL